MSCYSSGERGYPAGDSMPGRKRGNNMGRLRWLGGARSRFSVTGALVIAVVGLVVAFGDIVEAQSAFDPVPIDTNNDPLAYTKINEDGFGNCLNSYAWSMEWFKGHLYVGTNKGSFLQSIGFLDPDYHCTGVDPSVDPAAEIWRYTPETNTWELVFRSPTDVPVWGQPGVFTARDNGFRDMLVYTEADGTEALYVAGLIYPFLFETRTPRILRSTDGMNFEPIPEDPGTFLGDISKSGTGFRAMASYKGRFYITVGSVVGEGLILEASDPAGGNDNFRQVSPPGMLAFELSEFNGSLYVGSGEASAFTGFQVLKTDATPNGTPYYDFVPVVTNGAYGPYLLGPNNAVLSMKVFQDRLYIGGQNDLVRVNPDDTWDLVVGTPRSTPQGYLVPLSGLPQGFGNYFTGHFWRMEEQDGSLYLGTWDFSIFFRYFGILGQWIDQESGFDLWRTEDGVSWSETSRNGFGNKFNHGVRSLQSTPFGLFLGTANPWDGTEVFLGQRKAPTNTPQTSLGLLAVRPSAGASPSPPQRLEAESQGGSAVLSWEPSPLAVQFKILRAAQFPAPKVPNQALPADAWIPGPYVAIGTTTRSFFRDGTLANGYRYTYYVQAEGKQGQLSEASNVVMAPSFAPGVTFDQVLAKVRELSLQRKIKAPRTGARVSAYLAAARSATQRGQWLLARRSLEALYQTVKQTPREQLDPLAADDLEVMVAKLQRRVALARAGVLPKVEVVSAPKGSGIQPR